VANREVSPGDLIDARDLAARYTVEELAAKADELVRSMEDPTALLAKPLSSMREAPDLLACFGMLLGGLSPLPGMRVLDFGAGSCWTTHYLAQLGCRVVAMDVSAAMLDLGRQRFERQPLFGERPEPEFSLFDGRRMDLDDLSVDRILCFDALHHVPNLSKVLAEMGRVLKPGGVAGFSEPGPAHSKDPQSQHEMRRYGVPEFDLVVEKVWDHGRRAGFSDISLAVFTPAPQWVSLESLSALLRSSPHESGRARVANRFLDALPARVRGALRLASDLGPSGARVSASHLSHLRAVLVNRRMFLLRKAGSEVIDSREVTGLAAEIAVSELQLSRTDGSAKVSGSCKATNTGRNTWLPSSAGQGAVLLGLRVARGDHPASDHARVALSDKNVAPGESVEVRFETEVAVSPSDEGRVRLELDLVSEGIVWFSEVRGRPFVVEL
jgi:SAM-dependent methyltransferase